jgi:hypothetical protein
MKITRRNLAFAVLGSAGAAGAAQAPSPSEDLNAAAKEEARKNSEILSKVDLPMSTEPAFQFKA